MIQNFCTYDMIVVVMREVIDGSPSLGLAGSNVLPIAGGRGSSRGVASGGRLLLSGSPAALPPLCARPAGAPLALAGSVPLLAAANG